MPTFVVHRRSYHSVLTDALYQLEAELATGRISADDYRRCHENLIAQAGAERITTDQENTASQPAENRRNPFPPAFRWDTESPSGTTESTEEIITGPSQPSGEDHERTQAVHEPAPYLEANYGYDQQSGWAKQVSVPPWVSSDLPPIIESNAGWMMQGSALSFEAKSNSHWFNYLINALTRRSPAFRR
ncbi:MAG: hypothetical protein ACRDTF_10160 [Pseudonocardiaceae bacterium]